MCQTSFQPICCLFFTQVSIRKFGVPSPVASNNLSTTVFCKRFTNNICVFVNSPGMTAANLKTNGIMEVRKYQKNSCAQQNFRPKKFLTMSFVCCFTQLERTTSSWIINIRLLRQVVCVPVAFVELG